MSNPIIGGNEAADIAGISVDRVAAALREKTENHLREVGAYAISSAQHGRTLAWIRERLEAGEHLEDLLDL